MQINPQIFREYDIRGVVDVDLSPDFAYLLGRAYAELAQQENKNSIAVGYDTRLSSKIYCDSLLRGISDQGLDCFSTGMGPTPQLYYSIFAKQLGGGIQVTGSHNPAHMNGFKICLGTQTLSGSQIQDLKARMIRLKDMIRPKDPAPVGQGNISELNIRDQYVAELIDNCKPYMGERQLKVVVDAGNGVGGIVGPEILRGLGVEVIELYCEPDGNFPNHHPDPTEMKNLVDLIKEVKAHKADFGIGWDGDADRIGVVDQDGKVIFGDMLLLAFGREILKQVPGATIIGDVKCSDLLFDQLKSAGANAIMHKTGHSLIKGKLKETNGELAGEMSAHIFFKHRYYGYDDALYASARLCEIVSNMQGPISSLFEDLPATVCTPEIRVDCEEDLKFKVIEKAQDAFNDFQINTIDGVRVRFDSGWGLVRASNTQPVLVMRFEANSQENLDQYQKIVEDRIEGIKRELETQ